MNTAKEFITPVVNIIQDSTMISPTSNPEVSQAETTETTETSAKKPTYTIIRRKTPSGKYQEDFINLYDANFSGILGTTLGTLPCNN